MTGDSNNYQIKFGDYVLQAGVRKGGGLVADTYEVWVYDPDNDDFDGYCLSVGQTREAVLTETLEVLETAVASLRRQLEGQR